MTFEMSSRHSCRAILIGGLGIYAVPSSAQWLKPGPFQLRVGAVKPVFVDLDKDGDPDVLRTFINDSIPCQWIDDDDDMKLSDRQGDYDNDCLMIDRNRDGFYGHALDLAVDYVDDDGDGRPDLQLVADNARLTDRGWTPGHFMIAIDTDKDGIFNFINWQTLELEPWAHEGRANFYQDYSGHTLFLKVHTSVFNMNDPRLNWENPFLFYDPDGDGLSEMAIRMVDVPTIDLDAKHPVQLSGHITDVRMGFDLDNDNAPGNEFDFDLSLRFNGPGFDYRHHAHRFRNLRGLAAADSFFYDPRWRQMAELIYVDHDKAWQEVLQGKWQSCWLVFDEDDDCERWERVEFYEPADPFRIGSRQGGLDNNPQADASGDRGEWDMDNSGKGNLYIGSFDGKIHLYGAEWGAWRIDQNGRYYQGWQGWRHGADTIPHDGFIDEPERFGTIRYEDRNGNGFIDQLLFDFDGDRQYEDSLSVLAFGGRDAVAVYRIDTLNSSGFQRLFREAANRSWARAEAFMELSAGKGMSLQPYAYFMHPKSLQERYHFGFWLTQYLYMDLKRQAREKGDKIILEQLDRLYLQLDQYPK